MSRSPLCAGLAGGLLLLTALGAGAPAAQPGTLDVSGTTVGAPTAALPLFGSTPGACALAGDPEPYTPAPFTVTPDGSYAVDVVEPVSTIPDTDDTVLLVYEAPFDPADACARFVGIGNETAASGLTVTLSAATGYVLVVAGFLGTEDAFTVRITGPEGSTVSSGESNEPPVADAGPDQTVVAGQTVTLDGSASSDPDGDGLTYAWTLNGPGYTDEVLTGPTPTFCAATDGDYTASLVVYDGTDYSAPDAVTVTAITATDALDILLADVDALGPDGAGDDAGTLNGGQVRGLARKLEQAQKLLDKGKTAEALDVLAGFRQQAVDLWQLDGVLTEAQAAALVASVGAVTGAVGAPCTVGGAITGGAIASGAIAGGAIAGGASAARGSASGPEGGVPGAFVLSPAYPNPFAVSASVAFEVPEAAVVRVVVYDVLGREVALLVDGPFEPSRHEAVFDAAGLPSGTYLVRMTTDGGFVQTQRVTLMR